MTEGQGK